MKGNNKPKGFEFTSQKQGFQRFHTKEIKEIVDELENAEDSLKDAMLPFLCEIFGRFHDQKEIW